MWAGEAETNYMHIDNLRGIVATWLDCASYTTYTFVVRRMCGWEVLNRVPFPPIEFRMILC